jgi:hypothetical protein
MKLYVPMVIGFVHKIFQLLSSILKFCLPYIAMYFHTSQNQSFSNKHVQIDLNLLGGMHPKTKSNDYVKKQHYS